MQLIVTLTDKVRAPAQRSSQVLGMQDCTDADGWMV